MASHPLTGLFLLMQELDLLEILDLLVGSDGGLVAHLGFIKPNTISILLMKL